MLKKKYYYGKQVPGYYRVKGKKSFTYINLLRPAYFRNWKLFACDPIHGIGLVVMKTCQWIAGGLGMIVGLVENLI